MPEYFLPILNSLSGYKKVKEKIKKRDKEEYQRGIKEVVGKRIRILEVNVYKYEIYE